MSRLAITAVLFAVWATPAVAACDVGTVSVGNGFRKGDALVHLSEGALMSYVEGSIDSAVGAMMYGGNLECASASKACVEGKTNGQLAAMVRKYLNDHPEQWHLQGSIIIYNAIFGPCFKGASP